MTETQLDTAPKTDAVEQQLKNSYFQGCIGHILDMYKDIHFTDENKECTLIARSPLSPNTMILCKIEPDSVQKIIDFIHQLGVANGQQ